MAPSCASSAARRIAATKAGASVTVWSAGVIASTGSPPPSSAASAASVSAGAVLRPIGSSNSVALVMPCSRSCSSSRKRCSSLPTTSGAARCDAAGRRAPARRSTACWNRLDAPVEREKLLWKAAARQRPQPRAAAAGHDHRLNLNRHGCLARARVRVRSKNRWDCRAATPTHARTCRAARGARASRAGCCASDGSA